MSVSAALREVLLQPFEVPPTALQFITGPLFPFSPEAELLSRTPVDPGLQDAGFNNPYRTSIYPVTPDAVVGSQALGGNKRRAYLVIQNKGPGNLFVNFGMAADAINGITLVPSQSWELIGGEAGGSFVPPDSVYLLTDLAGTTAVIVEGVALARPPALN